MDINFEKVIYKKYIIMICKKALLFSLYSAIFLNQFKWFKKKKDNYIQKLSSLGLDGKKVYRLYKNIFLTKIVNALTLKSKTKIKELKENYNALIDVGYCEYVKFVHGMDGTTDSCSREAYLNNYPYDEKPLNVDLSPVDEILEFPKFDSIDVSIVIPCYNNFEITMQCLRSILKNTTKVNYEVIISDDKSKDEIKNISKYAHNVVYIKNENENGFVNNCNTGASVAKGKYIYFLNNDTQVQPGYLDSLVKTIEIDDSIGIVGSMLLFGDGSLQEAGGQIFRDVRGSNVGRGKKNIEDVDVNYVRDTDYISGAALMIKTDLFRDLGGFDTIYSPAYCEDSDLCLRTWYWKKKRVVYQPLSRVVHFEGQSFASKEKQKLMDRNNQILFDRFFNELAKYHGCADHNSFVYKDHSAGRKQMLVIDWKILSPSFDTGSRVTFQYMQLFKKMGMNVKYYPMDVYKEKSEFLTDIEQIGVEVIFEQLQCYLQKNGKFFDYVFINRPDITERFINILRKYTKAYIIYQGHDLHYLRRYRERLAQKNSNAKEIMLKEKQREFNVISYVDLPCFVSKEETDLVNKENPKAHCVTIPIFILDPLKMNCITYKAEERRDICFVAGFKHTPNVDGALWFVKQILPTVLKKIPDLKVYLIGSSPTPEVLALKSNNVFVTGYVTDEELQDYYSKVKMAIIPLNYGAGVKGKTVEAVYNKVPVLTTTIGAEGIDNSSNALTIEDDAKKFAEKLVEMYTDDNLLQSISNRSLKFIETQYTEEVARSIFDKYII